jgi:serine/threonine protein kinase
MVTTSASIFGYTPNYAPLEQIQGLGTDARSDIYALSATLYHLMTAVKPPDALTRAAALVNGQPDPLTPANEISGNIGPEVASVLARAMSQNRDQRYPTAAAMREALKGTEEAATLSGRSEAATVLLAPSAATLDEARRVDRVDIEPTVMKAGETTVVRSVAPKSRVWALGLGAVVLIGVLFGAFYAFQHRNSSSAVPAPTNSPEQKSGDPAAAESSPAAEHGATGPVSGGPNELKKVIISGHPPTANETARKNDQAVKSNDKSANAAHRPTPAQGDESFTPNVAPVVPNMPEINIPDLSRPNKRGVQRMGGTKVRNLPDGTQVMTLPDGMRVVTTPDGTRRVFGAGPRMMRKKHLQ